MRQLVAYLGGRGAADRPRIQYPSQSFPTLCRDCNGTRLGSQYDPHLVKLASAFGLWVRSAYKAGLTLPRSFSVRLKPQRVARSVIGHLLAAEERRDRTAELFDAPMLRDLRDYFLDPDAALPPEYSVYLWPYASDELVIVRAFGLVRPGVHDMIIGEVLKFFPLAFWLVSDVPENLEIPFAKLKLDNAVSLDHEMDLTITLDQIPPSSWPERPRPDEFVLLTTERTHIGSPRPRK